jgi:hypothetical protein
MRRLRSLFGKREGAEAPRPQGSRTQTVQRGSGGGESREHYELKCRECSFTHAIPMEFTDDTLAYVVDESETKITCLYGGRFTVTLKVADFFTIAKASAGGLELKASIVDNINPLHNHLMSHHDPLFLIIKQLPMETHHEYRKAEEGDTYVRFSKSGGVDVVGNIDLSKAEVPGVS